MSRNKITVPTLFLACLPFYSSLVQAATIELQLDNGWTVDLIDGYYGENPGIEGYGSSTYGEYISFSYRRELTDAEKIEYGIDPSVTVHDGGSNEVRFNGLDQGDSIGSMAVAFYRPETNRMMISISDGDWLGYEDRENISFSLNNYGNGMDTVIYSDAFDLPSVLNSIVGIDGYFTYSHEVRVISETQDPWTPYRDFTAIHSESGTTTLTSWNYKSAVVPLPGAFWLLVSGVLSLLALSRRKAIS